MNADQQTSGADGVRAIFRSLAKRPALVTIDLHRGHLDPEVATMPVPAEVGGPLVARCAGMLDRFRQEGVPIIHVVTKYNDRGEIISNPYWRIQASDSTSVRSRVAEHQLPGPGWEVMPGIEKPGDLRVDTKRRYDCFVATDLDFMLRSRGCDSVLLMGVNTNSCVLATAIAASVRDYAVFVIADGVASMMGGEYHEAALRVVAGSFGWVARGDEFADWIGA
jgi:biuret amidohydrolase